MREINLLEKSHPVIKRNIEPGWRKEENKKIAKIYGPDFFDGDRINGYGGYYYDGRWKKLVPNLEKEYGINSESSILDIGCAKGFLLYDLHEMIPGIKVAGLDISKYALNHAMDGFGNYLVKNKGILYNEASKLEKLTRKKVIPHMVYGSADELPWPDNSFDVVLSINVIHNLPEDKCKKAIKEMIRVGRNKENMFIQVDSYKTEEERERMKIWVLTAETMLSTDEWTNFFKKCGYDGDYYWTIV